MNWDPEDEEDFEEDERGEDDDMKERFPESTEGERNAGRFL